MEIWVPITLLAAFMQNVRSTTQKHLSKIVGTLGATFVRFGFGLPFVCLFVAIMHFGLGWELPKLNSTFGVWVVLGASSQIIAQIFLIKAFAHSNFTVATAYSRTEAIQAAFISFILLGEIINWQTALAISITVVGVILISLAKSSISFSAFALAIKSKSAQFGLIAGSFFGVSATSYRGASLSLESGLSEPNFLMQAGVTLLAAITFQSLTLFIWMLIYDRSEIVRVGKAWKWGLLAGFTGACASFGWFIGFTLQTAAVIKAVAQVEMLFTYASSIFIFKEKISRAELIGCALIVLGIIVLVLG
ncbi:MAG: EamA family transporter [Nitratireductor sp.]